MKKRFLVGIILIIFSFLISVNIYNVEAFSGELDPKGYIVIADTLFISDGIGTGTISLNTSSEYTISYQKVDITESTYNTIQNKREDLKTYIEETEVTLEEKVANVETLNNEYETLINSGTASQEQIEEAKNKYYEARDAYEEFDETVNTNIAQLTNEFYSLIPDYTNSWTVTTNTPNNVQLDLKNYSGKIYFILWVKIENETNTYYDMAIVSLNIQENQNENDNDNQEVEWTDFTNAKFELKKYGSSQATVEISNVTAKDNSQYYLIVSSNNSKPNVTREDLSDVIELKYDSEKKIFKMFNTSKMAKYVELNQDIYISILEIQENGKENLVVYGKKLEKYEEPKYSDAFFATFMTNDSDQLITTFTHCEENNRKIQIKIGKVTDKSILQKIKNKDSSGFSSLLSLAKSSEGIFDKIVDLKNNYNIEYCAGDAGDNSDVQVINLSGLQDEAYYFLYIKADDENGKYITQEAVTLAQADVFTDAWYMFFYGESDFKWADFEEPKDSTIFKEEIPYAGINAIVWFALISVVVGIGAFSYKQYRKNNF